YKSILIVELNNNGGPLSFNLLRFLRRSQAEMKSIRLEINIFMDFVLMEIKYAVSEENPEKLCREIIRLEGEILAMASTIEQQQKEFTDFKDRVVPIIAERICTFCYSASAMDLEEDQLTKPVSLGIDSGSKGTADDLSNSSQLMQIFLLPFASHGKKIIN
ncbi:penicillin-binding protein, partial [Striga asiatica]